MKKGESKVLQGAENKTIIKTANRLGCQKKTAWKSWGLWRQIRAVSADVGCSRSPNIPPWMDVAVAQPFPIRRHYRPLNCDWITTDERITGTLKSNERLVINAITRNTKRTNDDEPLKVKCQGFYYRWLLGFSPKNSWVGRRKTLTWVKARGFRKRWHKGVPYWYPFKDEIDGK